MKFSDFKLVKSSSLITQITARSFTVVAILAISLAACQNQESISEFNAPTSATNAPYSEVSGKTQTICTDGDGIGCLRSLCSDAGGEFDPTSITCRCKSSTDYFLTQPNAFGKVERVACTNIQLDTKQIMGTEYRSDFVAGRVRMLDLMGRYPSKYLDSNGRIQFQPGVLVPGANVSIERGKLFSGLYFFNFEIPNKAADAEEFGGYLDPDQDPRLGVSVKSYPRKRVIGVEPPNLERSASAIHDILNLAAWKLSYPELLDERWETQGDCRVSCLIQLKIQNLFADMVPVVEMREIEIKNGVRVHNRVAIYRKDSLQRRRPLLVGMVEDNPNSQIAVFAVGSLKGVDPELDPRLTRMTFYSAKGTEIERTMY